MVRGSDSHTQTQRMASTPRDRDDEIRMHTHALDVTVEFAVAAAVMARAMGIVTAMVSAEITLAFDLVANTVWRES